MTCESQSLALPGERDLAAEARGSAAHTPRCALRRSGSAPLDVVAVIGYHSPRFPRQIKSFEATDEGVAAEDTQVGMFACRGTAEALTRRAHQEKERK
jgi:hypothetical protein